jgi:hypothetical protein
MLLQDIQHLETCVGVDVKIFYSSVVVALVGIVILFAFNGENEYAGFGELCLVVSLLGLIWCDITSILGVCRSLQCMCSRQQAGRSQLTSDDAKFVVGMRGCRYICKKKAYINIGVIPGGGEMGSFNPFGSSPFWVPFHPKTEDVTNIIPAIRAQQDFSARGGGRVVGVAAGNADPTLVQLATPKDAPSITLA